MQNTANRCADPTAQYPKEEIVRVCPGAIPEKVKGENGGGRRVCNRMDGGDICVSYITVYYKI